MREIVNRVLSKSGALVERPRVLTDQRVVVVNVCDDTTIREERDLEEDLNRANHVEEIEPVRIGRAIYD